MSGRIVIFGATGYTGELTSRAMVARGLRPILAAQSQQRVRELASELGGLEWAVADAVRPASLAALVSHGDVLVTTVGPFARWGALVVEAALAAGAHYLDSTGEPSFIARVFRTWGPQAGTAGCALLTAHGFDYVAGNLAAALALGDAGPQATRVDVGYFAVGGDRAGIPAVSGGTRASVAMAALEPALVLRRARLVPELPGRRVRSFQVGRVGPAVGAAGARRLAGSSIGSSEPFTLPLLHPSLTDVGVYLGWAGGAPRVVQVLSYPITAALAVPGVRSAVQSLLVNFVKGSAGGPDAATRLRMASIVVAEASDAEGRLLGRALLRGPGPYDFTADFLAWAAGEVATAGVPEPGALGPVEAFGLSRLVEGAGEAGLGRVDENLS